MAAGFRFKKELLEAAATLPQSGHRHLRLARAALQAYLPPTHTRAWDALVSLTAPLTFSSAACKRLQCGCNAAILYLMSSIPRPLPPRREASGALTFTRDRALFANFYRRELFSRYLGSISGLAWALLHPLALLAVYHFVFTTIFRAGAMNGKSFLIFVAVALWPWLAAQEALQRGTVSIASHAGLIRKVAFPHELVVYASVAATLTLQLVGYIVVLVVLALFGEPVHFEGLLLALPLWMVLAVAVAGLSLALAALQVFVKDVEHILMPVLMILMYLTPILYPLTLVPEGMKPWVAANPFGYLVDRLRDALLEGRLALQWGDAAAVIVALALFVAGRWIFLRLSPHFEDFV